MNHTHWCLCVINFRLKRFEIWNSLANDVDTTATLVGAMKMYGAALKKSHNWEGWETFLGDATQQDNGDDCGVFTCMFMDYLSVDYPLIFEQAHITQCRQRIALSIEWRGDQVATPGNA